MKQQEEFVGAIGEGRINPALMEKKMSEPRLFGSTASLCRKRRRAATTMYTQKRDLNVLLGGLPGEDTVYKIISYSNLTALGFLAYVVERTVIRRMDIATFRVGPRALEALKRWASAGRIASARIVVGQIMQKDHRKQSAVQYWDDLKGLCSRYGWECATRDNHAKLLLMDTDDGKYILEGSCNLNEAPNWEQYSFAMDAELYDFYRVCFDEMLSPDRRGYTHKSLPCQAPTTAERLWAETKLELRGGG